MRKARKEGRGDPGVTIVTLIIYRSHPSFVKSRFFGHCGVLPYIPGIPGFKQHGGEENEAACSQT